MICMNLLNEEQGVALAPYKVTDTCRSTTILLIQILKKMILIENGCYVWMQISYMDMLWVTY
jgi:hypothetical protein